MKENDKEGLIRSLTRGITLEDDGRFTIISENGVYKASTSDFEPEKSLEITDRTPVFCVIPGWDNRSVIEIKALIDKVMSIVKEEPSVEVFDSFGESFMILEKTVEKYSGSILRKRPSLATSLISLAALAAIAEALTKD